MIEPGREVMITPLPLYHVFCLTGQRPRAGDG